MECGSTMKEIETIERLKKAIILLKGSLPVQKYSFESYELNTAPISYYKTELINIINDIHDEHFERHEHCYSDCCGSWKTGPAPDDCKRCPNYHLV